MPKNKIGKGKVPHPTKKPRVDPLLRPAVDDNPVWQISALDIDGPWGWQDIDKSYFFDHMFPRIRNFESMMWKEILGRDSHEVSVEEISKAAQKRLSEIKLEDFERLVSLRFTGKQRLWGIKIKNILKIIWWDPNHEVYPCKLKHT